MPESPTTYHVDLFERLRDLIPEWNRELGPEDVLEYTWHHGGEHLIRHREGGGTLDYRGVYHPNNGMCEPPGPGVCMWCGTTLW